MAKRKFAELELALVHLQQNVEIPEPVLIIHPVIGGVVDRVSFVPGWMMMRGKIRMKGKTKRHERCLMT